VAAEADPERPLAHARWLLAPESRALLAALGAEGHEARFVGGCVRDTLLDPHLDPADLDLATQERPEALHRRLEALGFKVVPTGLAHGTITVLVGKRHFEVTTLRRDVACFGRHAEVAFSEDFAEDAARRDFTINAMSCDGRGRLFDPFGGRADLASGRVRFVGEARQRIREDYLRILRFFRFWARFGRPPADPAALEACAAEAAGLERLSGERVRGELERLLLAPGAVPALVLMEEAGVRPHLLPVRPALERLARLVAIAHGADAILRLAALVRDRLDRAGLEALADRLRLANRERDRLLALATVALPDPLAGRAARERAVYRLGFPLWRDLVRLAAAERDLEGPALAALLEEMARFHPPTFPLTGADLLARGVAEGPGLGRLLAEVRAWWEAEGFVPDRAACLARLEALLEAGPRPG
jgi:poly(A) polymerase